MHGKRVSILFTSVGRRVELLRAFRAAYQELGLESHIVATDIDPLAPAMQLADRPYITPPVTSPDYVTALVDICLRERVRMVFPLIDPDVPVMARHRKILESTGARLAVVPEEAAGIAGDKWRTVRFFQDLELPVPASWLPGECDPDRLNYPLFIKPRAGSASKYAFQVRDSRELEFFSGYVPGPIIQECLPGPEITNDVVCNLDGEILAVVSRRRIEVRSGEVAKGVTVYDPAITEACLKIARSLPAVGPITVQCILKQGTPHFTEINVRLGGGIPLGIAAGVDAPRWLLAKAAGIDVEIPPFGSYRRGLYMTRFDDSFFLDAAGRDRIAMNRMDKAGSDTES